MLDVRYRSALSDSARWDGFHFRDDDIIISTPPKCGTTWTQMICALLIFQTPELDRPLTQISPWLDLQTKRRDDVITLLESQTHRRFIKTHTPLDGLPHDPQVTYIGVGRDPRDVGLSLANHFANLNTETTIRLCADVAAADYPAEPIPELPPIDSGPEAERFIYWVDDPTPLEYAISSLRSTIHHLSMFWEARNRNNIVLLHYADLEADLEGEMRRLARRLGIDVPAERWAGLVEAATFTRMRERASELIPSSDDGVFIDAQRFFFRGRSGQWLDIVDEETLRHYDARIADLASPDLAAWLHNHGE